MAISLISGHDTDILRLPLSHMDGQMIGSVNFGNELLHDFDLKAGISTSLVLPQWLKAMTSGRPNSDAHVSALAIWIATILVSPVHQPFPVATITSGS